MHFGGWLAHAYIHFSTLKVIFEHAKVHHSDKQNLLGADAPTLHIAWYLYKIKVIDSELKITTPMHSQ